jgi:hypothetical protein
VDCVVAKIAKKDAEPIWLHTLLVFLHKYGPYDMATHIVSDKTRHLAPVHIYIFQAQAIGQFAQGFRGPSCPHGHCMPLRGVVDFSYHQRDTRLHLGMVHLHG